MLYLLMTIAAAGMFHAATAYLPSTLAMYTMMLGTTAFVDRSSGFRTVEGVFWFAIGGLLGWPFSLAMVLPFTIEDLYLGVLKSGWANTVGRVFKAGVGALGVLVSGFGDKHYVFFADEFNRVLLPPLTPGRMANWKLYL